MGGQSGRSMGNPARACAKHWYHGQRTKEEQHLRILQALPALYSGGVERGTVEFAADLVRHGHESFVVSNGGPLAARLEAQGSTHIQMPVHRKSPASFGQIRPMRQLIQDLQPDIIHVRSRMPAWIVRLAWKGLPAHQQPAIVSTFHGMYSVNPYSAIMAKSDHVIAVSNCVRRLRYPEFSGAGSKPDRDTAGRGCGLFSAPRVTRHMATDSVWAVPSLTKQTHFDDAGAHFPLERTVAVS